MRNNDDVPYIVIDRDSGGMGSFLVGALVGAGLALLFAPQTGEETQEEIRERAKKLRSVAEERIKEAQQTLEVRLEGVREELHERVDQIKEAVDSGRQAAVEARGDLSDKLDRSKAAYRAGIEAAREAGQSGEGKASKGN
ncbi:MAG: YtxH domain-containing protein [Longimicrobiales bacterium]